MIFKVGQRVCWIERDSVDRNGIYVGGDANWSTVAVDGSEVECTVLTTRLKSLTVQDSVVQSEQPEPNLRCATTYTFYVKLMEKTRQVLPEALVTVEASSELSGRLRATKRYAEQHGISMWVLGIVTETVHQRETRARASEATGE